MKALKYFVVAILLISGLSSCMVAYERPGYRHPPRPHHHHHHHGWHR